GYTESYGVGGKDLYLIKTNSNGDVTWVKTYGNTLSDEGRAVQQTNDGGYVVTGLTDSLNQNHYSLWLIKTDSFGNAEWKKTYDDNGWGNNTWGNSVQQTTDGGYIVTGFYQGLVKQRDRLAYDLWIVRTDSVGNLLWTSGYGDRATVDEGKFVQLSSDGGYIITGFTTSFQASSGDVVLIKLNSLGGISWVETYDGENYFDAGNCAQPTSDGGYIITGTIASGYSSIYVDLWLIKTDSLGSTGIEEAIVPSSLANWQIEIYPNPFITSTTIILSLLSIERSVKDIELKIYDACGRLVKDFSLGTGHLALGTVVTWDGRDDRGRDVTSGIYFLKLKVKSERLSVEEVRKVIKIE
ncbi:T9SS type A sorting domain-containing protein, partial [candidate division WOR-3 bacterium]|nr:T9SS type A sorting domain-containing protein [candidate division WOR-3 bacterium]